MLLSTLGKHYCNGIYMLHFIMVPALFKVDIYLTVSLLLDLFYVINNILARKHFLRKWL